MDQKPRSRMLRRKTSLKRLPQYPLRTRYQQPSTSMKESDCLPFLYVQMLEWPASNSRDNGKRRCSALLKLPEAVKVLSTLITLNTVRIPVRSNIKSPSKSPIVCCREIHSAASCKISSNPFQILAIATSHRTQL